MRYKLERYETGQLEYMCVFDKLNNLLDEIVFQSPILIYGDIFIISAYFDQVDLPAQAEALHEEILCPPAE